MSNRNDYWAYLSLQNDGLTHYGVKGMKWGVRHDPVRVGDPRRRYRTDIDKKSSSNRKRLSTKAKIAIGVGIAAAAIGGGALYVRHINKVNVKIGQRQVDNLFNFRSGATPGGRVTAFNSGTYISKVDAGKYSDAMKYETKTANRLARTHMSYKDRVHSEVKNTPFKDRVAVARTAKKNPGRSVNDLPINYGSRIYGRDYNKVDRTIKANPGMHRDDILRKNPNNLAALEKHSWREYMEAIGAKARR